MARCLVVGSGGREHALVCALAASPRVATVWAMPGNGGTAGGKVRNVEDAGDVDAVAVWAATNKVDLAVIGPEGPLVAGLADALRAKGIACFGPGRAAAEIEASKAWSKQFMDRHGLRTARFATFKREQCEEARTWVRDATFDVVVKASGLAAGKGVLVPPRGDAAAADEAVKTLCSQADASCDEIVIEERLDGPEVSLLAWCDGSTCECMPPAQDHKRAHDYDRGLNTGGMGAYAPTPVITEPELEEARRMMRTAVEALKAEGRPFVGCLYGGFMLDPVRGPCLLEFNARFGDPETQVLLPLLQSDAYEVMKACADGALLPVRWKRACAATVVLASKGYPGKYAKGKEIRGIDEAEALLGVKVYHAGTRREASSLVTTGGRVLAATAVASELRGALSTSYAAASLVDFEGIFYRGDVGRKCLEAPLKIGVLGSTRGTSLQPVLDALRDLNAVVVVTMSDKADAPILQRARDCGVARVKHIPSKTPDGFRRTRDDYDAALTEELLDAGVDLVLLVGWMRILSSSFVARWRNRCLNVHPSLLPAFGGMMDLDVHRAVLESGATESGCTVHFVTDQVDGGAVVVQKACPVQRGMAAQDLKSAVQQLEGVALIEAVRRFAAGDAGARFAPRFITKPPPAQETSEKLTYRASGVDIDAGSALVDKIKPVAAATAVQGAVGSLGGFGAIFDLDAAGFGGDDVLLVSGTDGVGTKLRLASEALGATGKAYDRGLGVDLVAMCVNDVATTGATPLFFLDYYATAKLDVDRCAALVEGVAAACAESGCALVGGETAEMPGLYAPGDFDVAGFSVGAVRRRHLLPTLDAMCPGDKLVAVTSTGVHSNGFSLVRKALNERVAPSFAGGLDAALAAPASAFFDCPDDSTLADVLLKPTRLYAKHVAAATNAGRVKALAHITGGGLFDNLPRALPSRLAARVDAAAISPLPPLFAWLSRICGDLPDLELLRTFNCGVGLVLVVDAHDLDAVTAALTELSGDVKLIGDVVDNTNSPTDAATFILHNGPLRRLA